MRIVAIADTHCAHERLALPPGDVLIHAGDLCGAGELDELEDAAAWLAAQPHPIKIVVAGNHDWAFARAPTRARAALGPDITYLEDAATTIGGLRAWGSPWQPAFCGWAFNLPRGPELAARWALIPDDTALLITHGPPFGLGDAVSARRREGCADLRARVRVLAPRLHLFGHIHEDRGAWRRGPTVFANVTTAEATLPATVIELDLATDAILVDGAAVI
jgi:3',5'-cyclic AMP phosphodiesterase CpdA